MLVVAVIIFVLTLVFVIWQPKGLSVGWSASAGALLALATGAVSVGDVLEVTQIVWNATLTVVAVILISMLLDEAGFFEWAALHMANFAAGNGPLMFIGIIMLGASVTALFNNDGAVLILTPIVLAIVRALSFDNRTVLPFVMAGGFIADTASLPLMISNLVNIMSADFFDISFAAYAGRMVVPNLLAIASSLLVLYLFFRKSIPPRYRLDALKKPAEAIADMRLFRASWVVLGVLLAGYWIGDYFRFPVSFIALGAAGVLLLIARRNPHIRSFRLIREAPWTVVIFSIGMYIVVYGMHNAGLTAALSAVMEGFAAKGLYAASLGTGLLAAAMASLMNNLPSVMMNTLAIQDTQTDGLMREMLIYANVIGSDLGPKMTPIGSLATLLWLHVLSRKGVRITWGYYFRVGVVLTIPVLLVTLTGLYGWLRLLG